MGNDADMANSDNLKVEAPKTVDVPESAVAAAVAAAAGVKNEMVRLDAVRTKAGLAKGENYSCVMMAVEADATIRWGYQSTYLRTIGIQLTLATSSLKGARDESSSSWPSACRR